MRSLARILLLLALMAGTALAGKPSVTIQGKVVAPANSDVILDASGSVTDNPSGVIWAVEDNKGLIYGLATPPGSVANAWLGLKNVQPGDYAITAVAFGTDDKGQATTAVKVHRLIVTPGGVDPIPPPPDPGPGPNPPPPPPPPPPTPKPTGKLFATMVYPEADRTPGVLAAKSTQKIRDELARMDTTWHAFDADSDVVKTTFVNVKSPPPYLVVTTADGKIVKEMPVPATPDLIIQTIRSLR